MTLRNLTGGVASDVIRKGWILKEFRELKAECDGIVKRFEGFKMDPRWLPAKEEEATQLMPGRKEVQVERPRGGRVLLNLPPPPGHGVRKERSAADARPTLERGKVAERRAAAQQPELVATAAAEENVRLMSERPLWGVPPRRCACFSYKGGQE